MIFLISSTVLNIVFNRFFRILKIFILLKLETLSISYFNCFIFLNFYFIRINCFFYSSRLAGVLLWFFFGSCFVHWFVDLYMLFLHSWWCDTFYIIQVCLSLMENPPVSTSVCRDYRCEAHHLFYFSILKLHP